MGLRRAAEPWEPALAAECPLPMHRLRLQQPAAPPLPWQGTAAASPCSPGAERRAARVAEGLKNSGCGCHWGVQGTLLGSQRAVSHHHPRTPWIVLSKDATEQSKQRCDPGGGEAPFCAHFVFQKGKTLRFWLFCVSCWSQQIIRGMCSSLGKQQQQPQLPSSSSLVGLGLRYEFPVTRGLVQLPGI